MINQLLNYPEDSAGSIMTTEYVDLREEMTVGQAMAHIKKTGIHKETIYTCYITERRKLVGIVSAKDLMTTDDDVPIKDLMETEIISVYTHSDQEQVAQLFTKYDLLALPVIDQDGRMVGIVTFDDAMDVMVDEATEDITKMAAINPSEKTYFETSVLQHAKNRIPWLLILMFTSIITGTIITRYENAFAAIPLLVSFIPMLMDTGGNCGSQSATLIIRGIALDEIRFTDLFKVMFKEFRISLIVGAFSCCCQRCTYLYTVSQSRTCSCDCLLPDGNRDHGKAGWMYPPTSCQESKSRPCDHGISTDHNTGGYLLNPDLF